MDHFDWIVDSWRQRKLIWRSTSLSLYFFGVRRIKFNSMSNTPIWPSCYIIYLSMMPYTFFALFGFNRSIPQIININCDVMEDHTIFISTQYCSAASLCTRMRKREIGTARKIRRTDGRRLAVSRPVYFHQLILLYFLVVLPSWTRN